MSDRRERDLVHACYVEAFRILAGTPGGSVYSSPLMTLASVGVPLSGMNVGFMEPGAGAEEVAEALAHFERKLGVPFCLRFPGPPGASAAVALKESDLEQAEGPPGMLADCAEVMAKVTAGVEVTPVRTAEDEDAFVRINSEAFGIPQDLVRKVFGRHLVSKEIEQFVGRVGEAPVATSCSVLHGSAVGVYNVATLSEHRGRGFGAAMTKAAVAWGSDRGRFSATLQSSPMGVGIYERLGFRTLVPYTTYSREKS